MSSSSTLARRIDAERNRARILAVAREAFLDAGSEPSMAEIARRSGVGMATLYRNFTGKLELVEELYRGQVDDICAAAAAVQQDTPGNTFLAWLRGFHEAGAQKGPLASLLLATSGTGNSVLNQSRARVIAAGEPLLAAAQRTGEIRDDVALGEILDGVVAASQVPSDPASSGSVVQILFDGLSRRRA